ncbi:MAG: glycine cleavage system protein GcvH [Chloroflexi bacterium]|nr:glycine cleavage system protein GcvH [Chloroflexota bacterium]
MAEIPGDLNYTKEHEWVRVSDGMATIGITDYAQEQLGDVVFVELPPVGREVKQFDAFGVIESVKAASDLYTPVSGTVVEANQAVQSQPEMVNQSPYDKAWMVRVKLSNPKELEVLMSPADYEAYVATLAD